MPWLLSGLDTFWTLWRLAVMIECKLVLSNGVRPTEVPSDAPRPPNPPLRPAAQGTWLSHPGRLEIAFLRQTRQLAPSPTA